MLLVCGSLGAVLRQRGASPLQEGRPQLDVLKNEGRMRSWALLGSVLLLLLAQTARAIYEDQAGELDWGVENLGRVVATAYGGGDKRLSTSTARGASRSAFVATDSRSRALARIDAKTGAIKWRHVLTAGDAIDTIELTNFGLLSISGAGRNVRMWDAADGGLLWDNTLYNGNSDPATFKTAVLVGDDRILIVASRFAVFLSLKDGVIQWRSAFTTAFDDVRSTVLATDGSTLFVGGSSANGEQLVSVDVTTGAVAAVDVALEALGSYGLFKSETGEAALVIVTPTEISIRSLESRTKTKTFKASEITADEGTSRFVGLEPQVRHGLVVRLASGKRAYARLLSSLALDVSAVISGDGVISESLSDEATLFHVLLSSPGVVQVRTYSFSSQLNHIQWEADINVQAHGGSIADVFAGCPSRKKDGSAPRCRALLVMRDDGLVMTTNEDPSDVDGVVADKTFNNVLWTREEALANIKEVHWITPAETEIEKQPLKGIPSFAEDLQQDVERAKQLVEHLMTLSSSFFEEKGSRALDSKTRKEPANAHFFGFSKYIVVLTESGRLFAIRAETNVVAWSVFVGPDYRLFVTRDHPALGSGAELLLVSNTSKLLWVDGDDGRQVEVADASGRGSEWVVLLPKRKHSVDEDATLRRSIALVSRETLEVTILPKAAPGTSHPEVENFYFSRFDKESSSFLGYTIERDFDGSYKARQVWAVVIPAEQSLLATSRQRDGVVDSSVTVTGDDSLLLKYLNPHMFGIATQATEMLEGEQKTTSVLYISLIDSVTGRMIHRVRHLHGAGPVRIAQSENWVVYTYWNTKEKRTEVVSVSMFDGAVGSHSLNPWKRPAWSDFRSSYDPRTPFVLQKSFIFPARIETLSVTVTSRGITPQYVLVGMENGQIFKLNRALIDPRQPDKPPTPQEQEEGLHQYTPLIPLHNNLHSMVTYNKTIANLKSIATTAAELESTSLVFAHGLDFFYVRLAPAKAFDVLPQDFNYELLVLLCLGFLSATYLLKMLVLRKSLNEAWK